MQARIVRLFLDLECAVKVMCVIALLHVLIMSTYRIIFYIIMSLSATIVISYHDKFCHSLTTWAEKDYLFEDFRHSDHVNAGPSHFLGRKVMKGDSLQYTGKYIR